MADDVQAKIVAKLTGKESEKKEDPADMRAPAPRGIDISADDFDDDED